MLKGGASLTRRTLRRLLELLAAVARVPARWWLTGGALGMLAIGLPTGALMTAAGAGLAAAGWVAATVSIAGVLALGAWEAWLT